MKCQAKRTNGEPCKAWAIKGAKVCRVHGGSARQVRRKAVERVKEAKAAEVAKLFVEAVDTTPGEALVDLVQWTAGEVIYWRREVARIAEDSPEKLTASLARVESGEKSDMYFQVKTVEVQAHISYRMLTSAQERLAKFSAMALKAGVEERRIKLAENQGELVVMAIRMILSDLALTPEQQERVPEIVPRALRFVAGEA